MKKQPVPPYVLDEASVAESLAAWLNEIAKTVNAPERFKAEVLAPSAEEVRDCFDRNCTAMASVRISRRDASGWKPVKIPVPYPLHGVFVMGVGSSLMDRPVHARLMGWHPCLRRRLGVWVLRKHENSNEGIAEIELPATWNLQSSSDTDQHKGRSWSDEDEDPTDDPDDWATKDHTGEAGTEDHSGEAGTEEHSGDADTKDHTGEAGTEEHSGDADTKDHTGEADTKGHTGDGETEGPPGATEDESATDKGKSLWFLPRRQIEETLDRISCKSKEPIEELRSFLLDDNRIVLKATDKTRCNELLVNVAASANGKISDRDDLGTQRLYTYGVFLVENLVQLIANRWLDGPNDGPNPDYWSKNVDGLALSGCLHHRMEDRKAPHRWIRPLDTRNAIGAISDLTAFSRLHAHASRRKNLKSFERQNHPSFKGLVCPVQTPESEEVGVTLHLAAGAIADGDGILSPPQQGIGLGYAASLLPFYHHTDSARAMMGAKNLVQALPVKEAEEPLVTTGCERGVADALAPLAAVVLPPGDKGFFAPGRNLLVAYMPWFGLNYNDAIVANEDIADAMAVTKIKRFVRYLEPGEGFSRRIPDRTKVDADDTFGTISGACGRESLRCQASGMLIEVKFHDAKDPCGGMVEWTIAAEIRLGIGDKLMGRHGNKGIVAALLPASEMPRLPVDERLGELSGRPVDLVLNPLGVISRMNIGQLIESHAGLLLRLGETRLPVDIGMPFRKVDFELIQRCLSEINCGGDSLVDQCGRIRLTIPRKGERPEIQTESPVVVGVQYIVRLDQLPADKSHVRGEGSSHEYNRITGQATEGRERNGGQRVGEMEMWALDAYQADGLMGRILTDRYRPADSNDVESQTFAAITSLLFASGIVLEKSESGNYSMRWSDDDEIKKRCSPVCIPAQEPATRSALQAVYRCPHKKCDYRIGEVMGSLWKTGSSSPGLCVEDLLRDGGVRFVADTWETAIDTAAETRLPVAAGSTSFAVKKLWAEDNNVYVDINVGDRPYHAYARSAKSAKIVTQGEVTIGDLLKLPVTCPEHGKLELDALEPAGTFQVRVFGGMADPSVFGDDGRGWGFIRHSTPKRRLIASMYLGKWVEGRSDFGFVPVLPWTFREAHACADGTEKPHTLTIRYEELSKAASKKRIEKLRKAVREATSKQQKEKLKKAYWKDIRKAALDIFKYIGGMTRGKMGMIRRHGLGRRIDRSGRFVVVPDPNLEWDQAGLPVEVLLTLFRHEFLAEGERNTFLESCDAPAPDVFAARRDWDFLRDYRWPQHMPASLRKSASTVVDWYLKERKPLILVVRQPTLHCYNVKSLRPVLLHGSTAGLHHTGSGDESDSPAPPVLSINPLVCKSMACDFDGDTACVIAVGRDETSEAGRLLPTAAANLVSLADDSPVAGFDQDMVLGSYLISMDDALRDEFANRVLVEGCDECREFAEPARWNDETCTILLKHLSIKHPIEVAKRVTDWMRMAFDAATCKGISFGFFDIAAVGSQEVDRLIERWQGDESEVTREDLVKRNRDLDLAVAERIGGLVEARGVGDPGFGLAAIAHSGARGKKQIRQLAGARGYLDPGETVFEIRPADFFFATSLADGMDTDAAFLAAMNGRSSMVDKKLVTGSAGALTRKLVMACWPWRVEDGDCGNAPKGKRSPATCRWAKRKRICSECYGLLPDGSSPPHNFPAGLVAAQSIGERGTQLSMQGFHTGAKGIDIGSVSELLNKSPHLFGPSGGPEDFIRELRDIAAYEDIRSQHLELLWKIISAKSTGEGKLSDAVAREADSDIFMTLCGGRQSERIGKAIRGNKTSDGTSPLERIVLGRCGDSEELQDVPDPTPATPEPGERIDSSEISSRRNRQADRLRAALESCTFEAEASEADKEKNNADVVNAWRDPDDDPNKSAEIEDRINEWMLPSSTSARISMVVQCFDDTLRCHVEGPSGGKSDSAIMRLAEAFGLWLAKEHRDLLEGERIEWKKLAQNEMIATLKKDQAAGLPKIQPSTMSDFVNRAWLFWPTSCLPVRALFTFTGSIQAKPASPPTKDDFGSLFGAGL